MSDPRILACLQAAEELQKGRFALDLQVEGDDDVARLSRTLLALGSELEGSFEKIRTVARVTEQVNAGLILDDVLERVFDWFRPLVPYDRIGLALLEERGRTVRARWQRSDGRAHPLPENYSLPLKETSLGELLQTGRPRILNDLRAYLREHPHSHATNTVVKAGIRSSLTCPLVATGKPVGFLFFSSCDPDTYRDAHVDLYLQIAGHLATIIEKARLYEELAELNHLKDRFLGIAAHDLRSPLAFLRGYLELMREGYMGDLNPVQTDAVNKMEGICKVMLSLLNDLLSLNAIESGRVRMLPQKEDPRLLLRECATIGAMLAGRKGIRLLLDVPEDLPEIVCDRERLLQAVNNLLSNAVKFSLPGTEVLLQAVRDGDHLRVDVLDQGVGIPPEEMGRLFSFLERPSVRPTGGELSTGLGLPIVRRIVEAHGGTVHAKSSPEGSTFTIRLPLEGPPDEFLALG